MASATFLSALPPRCLAPPPYLPLATTSQPSAAAWTAAVEPTEPQRVPPPADAMANALSPPAAPALLQVKRLMLLAKQHSVPYQAASQGNALTRQLLLQGLQTVGAQLLVYQPSPLNISVLAAYTHAPDGTPTWDMTRHTVQAMLLGSLAPCYNRAVLFGSWRQVGSWLAAAPGQVPKPLQLPYSKVLNRAFIQLNTCLMQTATYMETCWTQLLASVGAPLPAPLLHFNQKWLKLLPSCLMANHWAYFWPGLCALAESPAYSQSALQLLAAAAPLLSETAWLPTWKLINTKIWQAQTDLSADHHDLLANLLRHRSRMEFSDACKQHIETDLLRLLSFPHWVHQPCTHLLQAWGKAVVTAHSWLSVAGQWTLHNSLHFTMLPQAPLHDATPELLQALLVLRKNLAKPLDPLPMWRHILQHQICLRSTKTLLETLGQLAAAMSPAEAHVACRTLLCGSATDLQFYLPAQSLVKMAPLDAELRHLLCDKLLADLALQPNFLTNVGLHTLDALLPNVSDTDARKICSFWLRQILLHTAEQQTAYNRCTILQLLAKREAYLQADDVRVIFEDLRHRLHSPVADPHADARTWRACINWVFCRPCKITERRSTLLLTLLVQKAWKNNHMPCHLTLQEFLQRLLKLPVDELQHGFNLLSGVLYQPA